MLTARCLVPLLVALAACGGDPAAPDAAGIDLAIVVDVGAPRGPVRHVHGFLHGAAAFAAELPAAELIAPLAPAYWRLHDGSTYGLAAAAGAKVSLQLFGLLEVLRGVNYREIRPWLDWDAYAADVQTVLDATTAAGADIDYIDFYSEPDNDWPGTPEQLLETYTRTIPIVRAWDPTVKIAGPDLARYSYDALTQFLLLMEQAGTRVDVVSWHEFVDPAEVGPHVAAIRSFLAEHPSLGALEIHLPDFIPPPTHLAPGFSLAWLAAADLAGVDYTARSCWPVTELGRGNYADCWRGMGGLLTGDNQEPQPNYWVYAAYAAQAGDRVAATGPDWIALGASSADRLDLMIGRHAGLVGAPATVSVTLNGLAFASSSARVELTRVPNHSTASAEIATVHAFSPASPEILSAPLVGGSATIEVPLLGPADVAILAVTPGS